MRRLPIFLLGVLLALAGCGGSKAEDTLVRARDEARKIDPDAALVEVDFSGFGFATSGSGIPDMSKAGPPKLAVFNFYSAKTGKGFRVDADINRDPMPADMQKTMEQQGYKDIRVEQGAVPFSPYTLPLPETIGDLDHALAAAGKTLDQDCAGEDPKLSTCRLVQDAELHMAWAGPQSAGGKPVWSISFGQKPNSAETVRRVIADGSYDTYDGGDAQAVDLSGLDLKPLHSVDIKAMPDFDSVWPAALAAIRQQDPLYAPYAVSLVTYLSDVADAGGKAVVSEVHIQLARVTPSLLWDAMEAHIAWRQGAADDAVVFFSDPRRQAFGDPKPMTLQPDELPKADPALEALLGNFPKGYTEVKTTWSQGCEDIMSFVVGLKMWRCGVYLPNEEHTDLVFLWLTGEGNPLWESARAPIASEYSAVAANTPKGGWAWWTRVKHPEAWAYFLTDAKEGKADPGFCTTPNNGLDPIEQRSCAP
jgi:hypothetical protein